MHIKLADTKYETCKCHNDTDLHILGDALLFWQVCLPAGPVIMGLNPHSDADLKKKKNYPALQADPISNEYQEMFREVMWLA